MIIEILIWLLIWIVQTILTFLLGVKLVSLTFRIDSKSDTDDRFLKILFGQDGYYRPLTTYAILAMFPVFSWFGLVITFLVFNISGELYFNKKKTFFIISICRAIFKKKYLLNVVAPNV